LKCKLLRIEGLVVLEKDLSWSSSAASANVNRDSVDLKVVDTYPPEDVLGNIVVVPLMTT